MTKTTSDVFDEISAMAQEGVLPDEPTAPPIDIEELRKGLLGGAWAIVRHSNCIAIETESGETVCWLEHWEDEANAKRIAALPGMLTELYRRQLVHESDQACIRDALAAIDKLHADAPLYLSAAIRRLQALNEEFLGANDRLRSQHAEMREALKDLAAAFVNPGDGAPYEAGEMPALDRARAILSKTETEQP